MFKIIHGLLGKLFQTSRLGQPAHADPPSAPAKGGQSLIIGDGLGFMVLPKAVMPNVFFPGGGEAACRFLRR